MFQRQIKLMDMQRKFGWTPDRPDFRDHAFELAKPIPLPDNVDLRSKMPPIVDQGDLGSCTANAIAAAYDFCRGLQHQPFMSPSRLFVYYNEREKEGTVNSDSGAMIRDGVKSIIKLGVCPESLWPYDTGKFSIKPSPPCYVEALNHQLLAYKRVAPTLNPMLYCLAYGYPFVFGFSVYESFMSDAVSKTGVVPMPDFTEQQVGGHAVVAVGYSKERRAFLVRNSWSESWGIAGHCWMPWEYLANQDLADDRWQLKLVE